MITFIFVVITAGLVLTGSLLPQYAYVFGALLGIDFIVFMWIAGKNGKKEGRKA